MKRPVAMVEPGGWGGICHYAYNLCQGLAARGTDVSLVTASPYELADRAHGFPVHPVIDHAEGYGRNLREVARAVAPGRRPILHLQATLSARKDWAALAAARAAGLPIVTTVHNVQPHDAAEREATGMRAAHAAIYQLSNALIVHGESNRSELLRTFTVDEKAVFEVPHGDYTFAGGREDWSRDDARARLSLPVDAPVALAFGAVRPYKGFDTLIPAFRGVVEAHPQARLLIVGKPQGLTERELTSLADRHGVADAVDLHLTYIPLEEIGLYFAAADLGVFPYSKVYQSGSIQLAYAFALPVVVSRVGALGEIVDDGRNGFLIPPDDVPALTAAILRVFGLDAGARDRMGAASLALAGSWSWERVAEMTERVYEAVS